MSEQLKPLFTATHKRTGKDMSYEIAINCSRIAFKDDGFDNQDDVTNQVNITFVTEEALQDRVDRLTAAIREALIWNPVDADEYTAKIFKKLAEAVKEDN